MMKNDNIKNKVRAKTFVGAEIDDLEKKINKWLSENAVNILEWRDIDDQSDRFSIILFYSEITKDDTQSDLLYS